MTKFKVAAILDNGAGFWKFDSKLIYNIGVKWGEVPSSGDKLQIVAPYKSNSLYTVQVSYSNHWDVPGKTFSNVLFYYMCSCCHLYQYKYKMLVSLC